MKMQSWQNGDLSSLRRHQKKIFLKNVLDAKELYEREKQTQDIVIRLIQEEQ